MLSSENDVYWLNPFSSCRERRKKRIVQVNSRLFVLDPGCLPFVYRRGDKLLSGLKDRLRLSIGRRILQDRNAAPDLILISDFSALFPAHYYKQKGVPVLYYCNDYFGSGWNEAVEKKLAGKSDWVFVTAPKLLERFEGINENLHFVPHGVHAFPAESMVFTRPGRPNVIGYIGSIRNQLDYTVFERILAETTCNIVLAGSMVDLVQSEREIWESLFNSPRVRYLGTKSRSEARDVMKQADILLLPYLKSVKSLHRFPLKFFEYLSVGKPVLATDFCSWKEPYRKYVQVIDEEKPLSVSVERVWDKYDKKDWRERISFARANTWQGRVAEIGRILSSGKDRTYG